MSRWLVGSSRISSCGASRVASASSRRARSPPDSVCRWASARGRGPGRSARAGCAALGRRRLRQSARDVVQRGLPPGPARPPGAGRNTPPAACRAVATGPLAGSSRPASSFAKVDLPLPLAPSRATRSPIWKFIPSARQHRGAAVTDRDPVQRQDRRGQVASARERLKLCCMLPRSRCRSREVFPARAAGSAPAAPCSQLARKRSTKDCMCARCASYLLGHLGLLHRLLGADTLTNSS